MAKVAATAAGAVLCAFVLTGCGAAAGRNTDSSGGSGAVSGSTTTAAPAGGQSGAGQASPAPDGTGTAQIDQNLAQIQTQLNGLDSEAAKADQSPQDGDGN